MSLPESSPVTALTPPADGGLARAAAVGSGWTALQGIANKLATMAAMYLVARNLSPTEYGMASLVLAAGGFLSMFPSFVMGDVIITHQRHAAVVVGIAASVVWRSAVLLSMGIAAAAPLVAWFYGQYPFVHLMTLLLVVAARPIGEAAAVIPQSDLRIAFRFRAIALIDGSVQLCATLLTVILALTTHDAISMVLPQVAGVLVRAACYGAVVRGVPRADRTQALHARRPKLRRAIRGRIRQEFVLAALAQYVHTLISGLPVLVLGRVSTEEQTGLFGFAVVLANQVSYVLSQQLGAVLQPIFGRLKSDPSRQITAFLRVVRMVSVIAVPASLLQAALAVPLFRIFFDQRWDGAVPVFAVLCIGQAFFFAAAPAMALLKAQGRFGPYFTWQLVQLAFSLVAYPLVAARGGAFGLSVLDSIVWSVSIPFAVWLAARGAGTSLREVLRPFLAPWALALPASLALWKSWDMLPSQGLLAASVWVFVAGSGAFVLCIYATRFTQPDAHAELSPYVMGATRRASRTLRALLRLGVVDR